MKSYKGRLKAMEEAGFETETVSAVYSEPGNEYSRIVKSGVGREEILETLASNDGQEFAGDYLNTVGGLRGLQSLGLSNNGSTIGYSRRRYEAIPRKKALESEDGRFLCVVEGDSHFTIGLRKRFDHSIPKEDRYSPDDYLDAGQTVNFKDPSTGTVSVLTVDGRSAPRSLHDATYTVSGDLE